MSKGTDIRITGATLYYLPVETRVPLKFGPETLTSVTCARVALEVERADGATAAGWGETPLSVQWAWPSALSYGERHGALTRFCKILVEAWTNRGYSGHPIEIGHAFLEEQLPVLHERFNADRDEPMPWLAALVCCSAFDIALHDAYGVVNEVAVYETYTAEFMNRDLSAYLISADSNEASFADKYPGDFFVEPPTRLLAWHLVGGKDLLDDSERDGSEPNDGYPVTLTEWIARDGLTCLKVKLRGDDAAWDLDRLLRVGRISAEHGVQSLTVDFNCTVTDPGYVTDILDRIARDDAALFDRILYVEQPFPYDLEAHRIDVHSVSSRKPLYMDESAHDWRLVRLGLSLGWTGVALKTCKTQTGALLSLCWAKAQGMGLMVQDLTNPMLAQIPHVLLAAHAGTIMGVETNAMQFYPRASDAEARVHPGLYERRNGSIDLSTLEGPGFGYCVERIERVLPRAAASARAR